MKQSLNLESPATPSPHSCLHISSSVGKMNCLFLLDKVHVAQQNKDFPRAVNSSALVIRSF